MKLRTPVLFLSRHHSGTGRWTWRQTRCRVTVSLNPILSLKIMVILSGELGSLAEMEDLLLRNLFQGYQRWVRPIQHANDRVTVRFGLKISQLVDVVRMHTTPRAHTQTRN
ncbi:neuronal acetylcholine receptor subunit non-alpha-2-like [Oncorhynchus tshawytscha]|uniref:neuronal acetylcholine receptor subunit non-alpha-2-like n=1 Tax=Oncorhynchus tshawytscha TaxID=74940 RepID=UPI001C3CD12D|nr:neuronal acetylcholine receptor subunit non-alpha-2-like [Oncorhynchus tshawytscha]